MLEKKVGILKPLNSKTYYKTIVIKTVVLVQSNVTEKRPQKLIHLHSHVIYDKSDTAIQRGKDPFFLQ